MTTTIIKETAGQNPEIHFCINKSYSHKVEIEQKILLDLHKRNELLEIDPIILLDADFWAYPKLMDNVTKSKFYSFVSGNHKILALSLLKNPLHEQEN